MDLILTLTPEEECKVEAAKAKGIDVNALLHSVLSDLPSPPFEDKTLELLSKWREEDATNDPDEIAEAERELAEFKANMNANRAASGEEPVY